MTRRDDPRDEREASVFLNARADLEQATRDFERRQRVGGRRKMTRDDYETVAAQLIGVCALFAWLYFFIKLFGSF